MTSPHPATELLAPAGEKAAAYAAFAFGADAIYTGLPASPPAPKPLTSLPATSKKSSPTPMPCPARAASTSPSTP